MIHEQARTAQAIQAKPASIADFSRLGFETRDSITVGGIPTSVATADFNRDGHADFVVACGWDNTLWLHLGSGDGSFEPARIIKVGESPVAVLALDLRRNGIFDLVVLEIDDRTVSVLRGRGDGTFENPVSRPMPLPARPTCMVDGDFNGDGVLDLAIGLYPTLDAVPLAVLPGDGHGDFGPFVWEPLPPAVPGGFAFCEGTLTIDAGDFDRDGDQDLVLGTDGELGGAYAYFNRGSGLFDRGERIWVNAAAWVLSVAAFDFDKDGDEDIQITDWWGIARRYVSSGDQHFNPDSGFLGLGTRAWTAALRDVTGDGEADLVAGGSVLSVLPNKGIGSFGRPYVYRGEQQIMGLAFADFNEDGKVDIVSANQANDTTTVFLNEGGGKFAGPQGRQIGLNPPLGPSNSPGTGVLFGDVDGNGATDIVSVSHAKDAGGRLIVTALNDGTGRFLDPVYTEAMDTPFLGDIALGDFRNTGKLDFLALGSPSICFAPSAGSGRFGFRTFSDLENPRAAGVLATGDFDRDGKLDFVAATQVITLFHGNGDGTFREAGYTPLAEQPTNPPVFVRAADFDKDGDLDVLVRVFGNGVPRVANDVYLLIGDGAGGFASPRIVLSNSGPIEVADVNSDGRPDILEIADSMDNYPDRTPARLTVHLGEPGGIFRKSGEYAPFSGWTDLPVLMYAHGHVPGYAPLVADFNGDRHPDVALYQNAGTDSTYFTYYQILAGNGDGTFTPCFQTLDDRGGLRLPQFAADVTGDGRDDMIVVDEAFSNFQVIPSVSAPPYQLDLISPVAGETGLGRITLNRPAEQAIAFGLTADRPEIHLPQTLSTPSGQRSVEFGFTIDSSFDWQRPFTISANAAGELRTATGYQWPKRTLYFPQIGDGVSGNIRFHTDIVLANVDAPGSAELEFYDSQGQPLVVDLRGRGAASVFRIPIGRGESVKLETTGEGELKVGYLRVVCDVGIDGTAVYVRSNLSGLTLYEAGIGKSQPLLTATLLVDLRKPGSTGIAIVNVAGAGSRYATDPRINQVKLRLYSGSFELLGARDLQLQPGEHRARFIQELFPDVDPLKLANLQGTLTFEASQPLAAVTLQQMDDPAVDFPADVPNLTTCPVARRSADSVVTSEDPALPYGLLLGKDRIIPHLADGCVGDECFRTQVSFLNPGPDTWTRMELHDPSGQPIEMDLSGLGKNSVFEFFMKSGETRTFETQGTGPLQVAHAWTRVGEIVESVAVFTRFNRQTGRVFYKTGVPATAPGQGFSIAVDTLGDADTGIAIANKIVSSTAQATLKFRLYDRGFRLLAESEYVLGPSEQIARFVSELFPLFPGAKEMEGILTVHSDFPVAAITLRQHENLAIPFPGFVPLLTTFPVLAGCPE